MLFPTRCHSSRCTVLPAQMVGVPTPASVLKAANPPPSGKVTFNMVSPADQGQEGLRDTGITVFPIHTLHKAVEEEERLRVRRSQHSQRPWPVNSGAVRAAQSPGGCLWKLHSAPSHICSRGTLQVKERSRACSILALWNNSLHRTS